MLNGHSQLPSQTSDIDELDGFLSMNGLNVIDMGKFIMKIQPNSDYVYQLKTDRASGAMNMMAKYREEGLFCDVILLVNDQQHPAHKIVLASTSRYFASMFGQPAHIEAQTNQVIDLSKTVRCPHVMTIILNFLYTSQVQLNDNCVGV